MGLWPHWEMSALLKGVQSHFKAKAFLDKACLPTGPSSTPPFVIPALKIPHQKPFLSLLPPSLLPSASVISASTEHSGHISRINGMLLKTQSGKEGTLTHRLSTAPGSDSPVVKPPPVKTGGCSFPTLG